MYFLNQALLSSDRSAPRVLSVYELLGGPVSRTRDKPVMCSVFLAVNPFPTPRLPSTKNNGENLREMFCWFPTRPLKPFRRNIHKRKTPRRPGPAGRDHSNSISGSTNSGAAKSVPFSRTSSTCRSTNNPFWRRRIQSWTRRGIPHQGAVAHVPTQEEMPSASPQSRRFLRRPQ